MSGRLLHAAARHPTVAQGLLLRTGGLCPARPALQSQGLSYSAALGAAPRSSFRARQSPGKSTGEGPGGVLHVKARTLSTTLVGDETATADEPPPGDYLSGLKHRRAPRAVQPAQGASQPVIQAASRFRRAGVPPGQGGPAPAPAPAPASPAGGSFPETRVSGGSQPQAESGAEDAVGAGGGGSEASGVAVRPDDIPYHVLLHRFLEHRSVALLLNAVDAPHPYQVRQDILRVNTERAAEWDGYTFTFSKREKAMCLAHCHVMLRLLADTGAAPAGSAVAGGGSAGAPEVKVDVEASRPGEIVLVNKSDQNPALYRYYGDYVRLWDEFKDEEVSVPMLDAALRCCSVIGDTDTAVKLYNDTRNRAVSNNPRVITALMWSFAEKGDMSRCVLLYNTLTSLKKKPSTDTFEALIHCANVTGEINTLLRVWRLCEQKYVEPRSATWEMTVNGCLDNGFKHHAVLFYEKYQGTGGMPSAHLQMRMSLSYSKSIEENLTPGSSIPNAVTRSPHLNYKMFLDFCRVKSLRDHVLPDHVPALHTHFFAPVDGAGNGMGVTYQNLKPANIGSVEQPYNVLTTDRNDLFEHQKRGKNSLEFSPPGNKTPQRKKANLKRPMPKWKSEYRMMTGERVAHKGIIQCPFGSKGRGPWADEAMTTVFRNRVTLEEQND